MTNPPAATKPPMQTSRAVAPAEPGRDLARVTPAAGTVAALVQTKLYQDKFKEVLGQRAPQFIASLTTLVYANKQLKECDPRTVIAAAIQAAALDLPIDPNLGFAYIIPYKTEARFQAGWKTYVQLAHRTGQYHNIHVAEVYTGMVKSVHPFTGVPVFGERSGDDVTGYMAYFQLTNGFEKYLYMTSEALLAHGEKYSKTFRRDDSKWKTDFPAMAKKTVIKQLLSKWGPLSIEMRTVLAAEAVAEDEPADGPVAPGDKAALFGEDEPPAAASSEPPSNAELDRMIVESEAGQ